MRRRLAAGAGALLLLTLALVALSFWERANPPPPRAPELTLAPAAFADLQGWPDDDHAAALSAFLRSCDRLARLPPDRAAGGGAWAGKVADWRPACDGARAPAVPARAFFEAAFLPYVVGSDGAPEGLFTGYYEPLLEGSPVRDERFRVPLHRLPPELAPKAEKPAPYHDRAAIVRGALSGRGLELLWVDDPVAAFFLQVQGSGRVRLPDGSVVRVGYAGQNGRPYRAIGRDLLEAGALPKGGVSLQSITAWLRANPDRAGEVMDKNPSYVFFRFLGELDGPLGPPGAQGVPLTPGRSLAVDRSHLPLSAPLWLEAKVPTPGGGTALLRRLVVAQDTGGAIKGPVRGDLFWGAGPEAEFAAGHMQSRGRYYILLPRSLAPTS